MGLRGERGGEVGRSSGGGGAKKAGPKGLLFDAKYSNFYDLKSHVMHLLRERYLRSNFAKFSKPAQSWRIWRRNFKIKTDFVKVSRPFWNFR